MESAQETEADSFEDSPIPPTRIAAAAGVMDVVAFSVVGYAALDDIAIGGIAGLLVGVGVFCFLPVFMSADEDSSFEELAPADDDAPLREFHRLAGGFSFAGAGMLLLAAGFAEVDLLVGLPGALAAAVVIYLGAGFALPNARPPNRRRADR